MREKDHVCLEAVQEAVNCQFDAIVPLYAMVLSASARALYGDAILPPTSDSRRHKMPRKSPNGLFFSIDSSLKGRVNL